MSWASSPASVVKIRWMTIDLSSLHCEVDTDIWSASMVGTTLCNSAPLPLSQNTLRQTTDMASPPLLTMTTSSYYYWSVGEQLHGQSFRMNSHALWSGKDHLTQDQRCIPCPGSCGATAAISSLDRWRKHFLPRKPLAICADLVV